jgi:hypothetical protein
MKKSILVIVAVLSMPAVLLAIVPVAAQSAGTPGPYGSTAPTRQLPVKGAKSANSCAAYGPGFIKVEGTDSCVKIGGALSVGAGGTVGR